MQKTQSTPNDRRKISYYIVFRMAVILTVISIAAITIRMVDSHNRGLTRTSIPVADGQKKSASFFKDSTTNFTDWTLRLDCPDTRGLSVRWDGYIWFDKSHELLIACDGAASLDIDRITILQKNTDWQYTQQETREITAGCHRISIKYSDNSGRSALSLSRIIDGKITPCPPYILSTTPLKPLNIMLRRASDIMWMLTPGLVILSIILWLHLALWFMRLKQITMPSGSFFISVAILTVIGFVLRLVLVSRAEWAMLADEAIVGIMGQRIAAGGYFPLIYLGQYYGGPFEAYLMAPLFMIFGASRFVLRMTPLLLSTLAIPLFGWSGVRCFGKTAGLVAAALWAIPPVMPLVYSIMVMVGPIENILIIVFVIGVWGSPSARRNITPSTTFLTGLVLGIAFWINAQILYLLIPLTLFMFTPFNPKRNIRFFGLYFGAMFIGILPLVIFNILHPLKTFAAMTASDGHGSFASNFISDFFYWAMPVLVGQKVNWNITQNITLWPLAWFPALLAGMILVYAVAEIIRKSIKRHSLSIANQDRAILFLLVVSLITGIVLFSASNLETKDPRHLFLITPFMVLLFAWAVNSIARFSISAAVMLVVLQLFMNLQGIMQSDTRCYFQPIHTIAAGKIVPPNLNNAISILQKNRSDCVYVDYWIGANLSFDMQQETSVYAVPKNRLEDLADAAIQSVTPSYIFHHNDIHQPAGDVFLRQLGWRREAAPPLMLYFAEQPLLHAKSEWRTTVASQDIKIQFACDGALQTYWTPLNNEAEINIELPDDSCIKRVAVISSKLSGEARFSMSLGQGGVSAVRIEMVHDQITTLTTIDVNAVRSKKLTIHLPEGYAKGQFRIYEIFLF